MNGDGVEELILTLNFALLNKPENKMFYVAKLSVPDRTAQSLAAEIIEMKQTADAESQILI